MCFARKLSDSKNSAGRCYVSVRRVKAAEGRHSHYSSAVVWQTFKLFEVGDKLIVFESFESRARYFNSTFQSIIYFVSFLI